MRKKDSKDRRFRDLCRFLRAEFPPQYSIRVWRTDLRGSHGIANYHNKRFTIKVQKTDAWTIQFDTILHEWAHCLTWHNADTKKQDHSVSWARAFARLYTASDKFWKDRKRMGAA